jgi:hypothetical protein
LNGAKSPADNKTPEDRVPELGLLVAEELGERELVGDDGPLVAPGVGEWVAAVVGPR